jgi:biotin carboxyl carrier protein
MKMENSIKARTAGVVNHVAVEPGQTVSPGDPLMWIG